MAKHAPYVSGQWGTSSEDTLRNNFPVHRACRDGDVEELERLLSSGKHGVEEGDSFYGWTPAHWSAFFNRIDCLSKVLRFGGTDGSRIVYALANFSVDRPTKQFGQTPLHTATFAGNPECVKWLLYCGAKLDKQDYLGETPLHKAARAGTVPCARMLAAHAASCALRNNNGQTPRELAVACKQPEVAEYLRQVEEFTTGKPVQAPSEGAMEEDDAMESGEAAFVGATPEPVSGNDVLADKAVAANIVPIGGRKRSRPGREDSAPKRIRMDSFHEGQVPNLSFLFKEADGMGEITASPTDNSARAIVPSIPQPGDVPNPVHFGGRPLFYSPASVSRPSGISSEETNGSNAAMEDDEMIGERVEECVKPRTSASCPRLYDRYPGSLEFGHRGVAAANPPSFGPRDDGEAVGKSHCFLSSSNHYNNNSPVHRNRSGTAASSGWTEHCSSVLQEQDYCANYSQLMGDEMFKNIHGC